MKTNEEFNNLMKLDKHILLNSLILPGMNEEICIPVGAINSKETFSLDICRKNTIVLSRKKWLFVKHGGNPLYISCVICNHTRFLYSIT